MEGIYPVNHARIVPGLLVLEKIIDNYSGLVDCQCTIFSLSFFILSNISFLSVSVFF